MTPAHSPAPWYRPQDPQHHAEVYVTETEDREDLEIISEGGPALDDYEALANGCLIEVSPELLEAVKTFELWLRREDKGVTFPEGESRDTPEGQRIWQAWWDRNLHLCGLAEEQARAAIAKYEEGVRIGHEAIDRMRAEHKAKAEPTMFDTKALAPGGGLGLGPGPGP